MLCTSPQTPATHIGITTTAARSTLEPLAKLKLRLCGLLATFPSGEMLLKLLAPCTTVHAPRASGVDYRQPRLVDVGTRAKLVKALGLEFPGDTRHG